MNNIIINFFKYIYYFGWCKKSPRLDKLDILLIFYNEVKIKEVVVGSKQSEYFNVYFEDGTEVQLKNNFKEGSRWGEHNKDRKIKKFWLSSGKINFTNKNTLRWSDKTPSWEIISKYKSLYKKQRRKETLEKRRREIEWKKEDKILKKQHKIDMKNKKEKEYNDFMKNNIPLKVSRKIKLEELKKKV